MRTRAVGLGLAACLGLAGCSFASESVAGDGSSSAAAPTSTATTATAGTPATAAGTTSSRPASPTTVRGLCAQALPDRTLLGWGAATVGDFRAYRYGASNNQPLAKAFPNADDAEAGGWCATRAAKQATTWWAVVYDRRPRRAITVVGPGEGKHLGRVSGPQVVP